MSNTNCILFCRCGAGVISDERVDKLASEFHRLDADVFELRDLCAFAVNGQKQLQKIADSYSRKIVVACYPRAIKNMLYQGGVEMGEFVVLNFREMENTPLINELKTTHFIREGNPNYQEVNTALNIPAWYPVIDKSRCTACGQCARFCLFGVYRHERKSLNVVNPLNCKNNCPACGRTCPAQAIIFPRLAENSILSGSEPTEKAQADLGGKGSLLVMLSERNKNRQSIFRSGVVQLAEEERRKALTEIQKFNPKKD